MAIYEESHRHEAPVQTGASGAAVEEGESGHARSGPEESGEPGQVPAGPEESSSAEQVIEQLVRFEHYVMKSSQGDVFARMAELDLSISQLRLLFLLDSTGTEQAVHELAEGLDLSVAATGRAVDVLARLGLATRREDELDRRVKRIAVTDAGREAVRELAAARRQSLLRMVTMLNEDERDELSVALQRVLAHPEVREFERHHPSPGCVGDVVNARVEGDDPGEARLPDEA